MFGIHDNKIKHWQKGFLTDHLLSKNFKCNLMNTAGSAGPLSNRQGESKAELADLYILVLLFDSCFLVSWMGPTAAAAALSAALTAGHNRVCKACLRSYSTTMY